MSDCAHAIKPFDTYYLQDEFVSGPFCPYCRIQQLEKWRQNDCRIIDAQRQRIQQLEAGINRAGTYLSQGEPNIARETLAALLKEPT